MTVTLPYTDKMGRRFEIKGTPSQTVGEVLRANKLPTHASVVLDQGRPIHEDLVKIHPGIQLKINANYNFQKFLECEERRHRVAEPIYQRSFLEFTKEAVIKHTFEYDAKTFPEFYEETLEKTIRDEKLFEKGDRILIGLSSGADSIALTVALSRMQKRLPEVTLITATLAGIPDTTQEKDLILPKKVAADHRLAHQVITAQDIQRVLHTNQSFMTILSRLLSDNQHHWAIYIYQHAIRRNLEELCKQHRCNKIILATELEDIVSGILSSYTTGYPLLGLSKKKVGDLTYVYPLIHTFKKENLLYLFHTAPQYTGFSRSGEVHIQAPSSRSAYFMLFEQMNNLWPGIERHLYAGYRQLFPSSEKPFFQCTNCQGLFHQVDQEKPALCDACQIFDKYGFIS